MSEKQDNTINIEAMDNNFKLFVTLDIGTTRITAVATRIYHNNSRYEVIGVSKEECNSLKNGIIINPIEVSSTIKTVIKELSDKLSIQISELYVTISSYKLKNVSNLCYRIIQENTPISKVDIEQLLGDNYRYAVNLGEQILHVIPQNFYVDKELVEGNPIGMDCNRLEGEYNIIIAEQEIITNVRRSVSMAGFNVAEIIASPVATAYGTLSEEEMEAGVVVVDIGAATTDVAIFTHGILRYVATIPFGGANITSDVKEAFAVLPKQAEALKRRFGVALEQKVIDEEEFFISVPRVKGWTPKEVSRKDLAAVIEARMAEIIDIVSKHIEISETYDDIGAGIVVLGGGSNLFEIESLINLKTGLDVKKGDYAPMFDVSDYVGKKPTSVSLGLLRSKGLYTQVEAKEQKLFEVEAKEPVKKEAPKKEKSQKKKIADKILNWSLTSLFDSTDTEM